MKLDDWHSDLWFGCLMNQSLGQWVIFSCYSRSTALTESFCFAVFTNHKTYLWSRLCLIKDETICCCPPCNSLNFGKGALGRTNWNTSIWCLNRYYISDASCSQCTLLPSISIFFGSILFPRWSYKNTDWLWEVLTSVPLWYHAMRPYLILQIVYGIDDFSFPFLQGS